MRTQMCGTLGSEESQVQVVRKNLFLRRLLRKVCRQKNIMRFSQVQVHRIWCGLWSSKSNVRMYGSKSCLAFKVYNNYENLIFFHRDLSERFVSRINQRLSTSRVTNVEAICFALVIYKSKDSSCGSLFFVVYRQVFEPSFKRFR